MPETMSVTEARDNFPSLVRRVAGLDEAVDLLLLVTSCLPGECPDDRRS